MNNNEHEELPDELTEEEFDAEHERQLSLGPQMTDEHIGRIGQRLQAEHAQPFPIPIRIEMLEARLRQAFEHAYPVRTGDQMILDGVVGEADQGRNGPDGGVAPGPDDAQAMIDFLREEAEQAREAAEATESEESDGSHDSEEPLSPDEAEVHHDEPGVLGLVPRLDECSYCCEDLDLDDEGLAFCEPYGPICRTCVGKVFNEASRDNKYPARYRGHRLRTETYRDTLPPDVLQRYLEVKRSRYAYPFLRIFCCDDYVGAVELGAAANIPLPVPCPKEDCGKVWCGRCKKLITSDEEAAKHANCHFDMEEAKAARDKVVENQVAGKDYRFCPRCWRMYAHRDACNHMTCHCGAEFCFPCGKLAKGGSGHWSGGPGTCPRYPIPPVPAAAPTAAPVAPPAAAPAPDQDVEMADNPASGDDADNDSDDIGSQDASGLDLLAAAAAYIHQEDTARDAARLARQRLPAFDREAPIANGEVPRPQVGGRLPVRNLLNDLPPPARAGREQRQWQNVAALLEGDETAGSRVLALRIRAAANNGQSPGELPPSDTEDEDEDDEMEDV